MNHFPGISVPTLLGGGVDATLKHPLLVIYILLAVVLVLLLGILVLLGRLRKEREEHSTANGSASGWGVNQSADMKPEEAVDKPLARDDVFMNNLYRLMDKELPNSEFGVQQMADMMHVSRTKLYYMVKELAGVNPSILLKKYKLNRAAQLLAEGKCNVSEAADMTGFSTLSHFSISFKKEFGVNPSDYIK